VPGQADGVGTFAIFKDPFGISVRDSTGVVYLADRGNKRICAIAPDGSVTTLATGFTHPVEVSVRDSTGVVFVADYSACRIYAIAPGAAPFEALLVAFFNWLELHKGVEADTYSPTM
jgi:DNA-binding beta-propeller fold protein YncE